jgi:hypothetical protein
VLAYSGSTWTQVVVAFSIFVPVVVTIGLTYVFLHGKKDDPDEQRLKRAQQDWEARHRNRAP